MCKAVAISKLSGERSFVCQHRLIEQLTGLRMMKTKRPYPEHSALQEYLSRIVYLLLSQQVRYRILRDNCINLTLLNLITGRNSYFFHYLMEGATLLHLSFIGVRWPMVLHICI